ncbi:hypothetical protein AQUCO_01400535v1 [Aquilegia coerulea]|uniref:C2 NT-type domain-containing protein n=1 Tax=Aquilegia coerulea TaxID=218851 RepID=A0A2G5DWX3_AQUCA|nr:hypothetical protein AQUCO_01400535v1 [Aquilegia coerulea]
MSRTYKWKLEKIKVKVVFRLQFHATNIPQTGWDKLFVSFIAADSGKLTAKTGKSNVRNGTCKWADPIYETTRLLRDTNSKQFDDKFYKIIVGMGSSRSSLLGEASINLADYADASKPASVALPLHGCDYGSVLHVTVQLLTSKTGFREFEKQSELRERGLQTANQNNRDDTDEKLSTSTGMISGQIDKVNSKVRFQSESSKSPSLGEVELIEDYAESVVGVDDSSNTSESLYTEKHGSSIHENESLKSTISGDLGGMHLSHSPHTEKGDTSDHRHLTQGGNDWVHGWSSDYSMDNDLVAAYEENSRLRGSLEMAETSILELKLEVNSLHTHADELGVETQKCCQLLANEITSGEELAKEVSALKSECLKFKDDFEQLKHSKLNSDLTGREDVLKNWVHLFQDQQRRWQEGLISMEDQVSEVENKTCHQEFASDFSFLHPDLEALRHILQDLKQDTGEVTSLLNAELTEQAILKNIGAVPIPDPVRLVEGYKLEAIGADQYHVEGVNNCLSRPGRVFRESYPLDATNELRDTICVLQRELEESKTGQDRLTRKMDQMECYYEAFIQELEENQKRMLGELHNLRNEHSTCLFTITSCNSQMEKMHEDFNKQLLRFSEEKRELESVNKELERRAISSETALKRAQWNSSIAVNQLQKDLELLSFQVLSMFKTNENLIKQAFTETSQSCFQEYPEEHSEAVDSFSHKDYESFLQNQYKTRLQDSEAVISVSHQNELVPRSDVAMPRTECLNQNAELRRQFLSGEILYKNSQRSLHLQEELQAKAEAELVEMHLANINLDVFAKVLQEAWFEASNGINIMKEKMDGLACKLALSTKSEESLMLELQAALEDADALRSYEENWSNKCAELNSQNQIVEEKFRSMSKENGFLAQKITDYERMVMEYRSYKSRYEGCNREKTELVSLLQKETSLKCELRDEISSMHEELNLLKAEVAEQSSSNGNLEKTLSFVQDKLVDLRSNMISHGISGQLLSDVVLHDIENADLISIILHLEELQKKTCEKMFQLTREKKDEAEQRAAAQVLLAGIESEFMFLKKKYESDVQGMVNKLVVSNDLVAKFQQELETVANKLKISLELEERYADEIKDLSSKLAGFEDELRNVTDVNRDLAQQILTLECVNEELERTKLTVVDSEQEKQALVLSLRSGNEESVILSNELSNLMGKVRCMTDELNSERILKFKLEGDIADLTSELKMKNDLLISFDKEKAELVHLKQLVSDLEIENSSVCHRLLQSEECLRKADEDASSFRLQVIDLETHLTISQESFLTADVELTYIRELFQTRMGELVQQLESLDGCYRELHFKNLDVLTSLNGRISTEAQYVEENARLLTVLASVRSELEVNANEKSSLVKKNNVISAELEKFKNKEAVSESSDIQNKHEIERLKHMLQSSEELIDNLRFSRDELEIIVTVLRAKLKEQSILISSLEKYGNEVMMLQNQRSELSQKLSEQILKTEEFKNLSVHLKEMKDKADAECIKAREKREVEVPSVAVQESLRMVFIREQCETKLQELRNQLYVSKRHGEEMLLKLQDALSEVENRRKGEVSHIKRNEELLLKISELETELQAVLVDKREKVNALDKTKAELECSLICLDCCKEEKQKLEASLQECIEEMTEIAVKFDKMKAELECSLISLDQCKAVKQNLEASLQESIEEKTKLAAELGSVKESLKSLAPSILKGGNFKPYVVGSLSAQPATKDASCEEDAAQAPVQVVINQEDLRQLALIKEHFKAESLKSSMEHLHKELEKMKNENSNSLPLDVNQFEPVFHDLQRQILQLHKANEHLGSIFPLFQEFPGSGNALERVLALEIELAEALQAKKKSNIQSSFLKQHSDEEAVFQSFRDINELIKDMLELKGRYGAVETELKEMHDRYSQLSLQFAEVEGERQKLVMTLKNVRSPKKTSHLHRSTSATLEDHL